jgi:hypothetical protein
MKANLYFLILLCLSTYNVSGQNDTVPKHKIKKVYRHAFYLSNTLNFVINDKNYPYCIMESTGISDPILDYKAKLFRNALHDITVSPMFEYQYVGHKGNLHSFGIGYSKYEFDDYSHTYRSQGSFQTVYTNYQFAFIFLKNKELPIHPFIAAQEFVAYKYYNDTRLPEDSYPPYICYYYIKDKSLLFLTQIPVGVIYSDKHYSFIFNFTFNFSAIVFGNHRFDPDSGGGYSPDNINYSKFLFLNKVISEKYILQNIQFKFGYRF